MSQHQQTENVVIFNASLFFIKCNPSRPSRKMDPNNPQWECQIRTQDVEMRKYWESFGLQPKWQALDKDNPNAGGFWRVNLSKKAFKKDGNPAKIIEVISGDMRPLDPDRIGNGSIGNVRTFTRQGTDKQGRPATFHTLAGIQVTHLIAYEPRQGGGFEAAGFTSSGGAVDPDDYEPTDERHENPGHGMDQGFAPHNYQAPSQQQAPAPKAPAPMVPPPARLAPPTTTVTAPTTTAGAPPQSGAPVNFTVPTQTPVNPNRNLDSF